ncbi:hypothetical protein JTB14_016672 [Gonioctena quinquepunctata]|nr:hypothetical protein JTB14_016672 [Gonioctena quinquepunctata]
MGRILTRFLADDAFPLKEYLLKPFSDQGSLTLNEKIFIYRLSRARRIVENALGSSVSRFRIYEKPVAVCPNEVDKIVQATCAQYIWLRMRMTSNTYIQHCMMDAEDCDNGNVIDGLWRTPLPDHLSKDESNN